MATGAQLQQVMMMSSGHCDDVTVDQVTQQVAELEATREQLEQDLFTAKQSLEELQSAHVKVRNVKCMWMGLCTRGLCNSLMCAQCCE